MTPTDNLRVTIPSRLPDDVCAGVYRMANKYDRLVWYARKAPSDHPSWDGVPEDIKTGALNEAACVSEMYPDETDNLRGETGDWEHGFNSGMLAAMRWILDACDLDDLEGFGPIGSVDYADENFPSLDT